MTGIPNMEVTWLDPHPEDGLRYPYTLSERLPKKYSDPHGRNVYSFLASLSCFGHRCLSNVAFTQTTSDELLNFIPTATRFCENTAQPDDLRTLFRNIPPYETKSRVIFLSTVLQNNASALITAIDDMSNYEHIMFVDWGENEAFSIYYFVPAQCTIDIYCIGQNDMDTITRICNTIHGWYILFQGHKPLTIRQRLQTPTAFSQNPTVFTFILANTLHMHANYLDLNSDSIAIQQLSLLPEMIEMHDASFGRIDSGSVSKRSHPFFAKFNPASDDPQEIQTLGWSIFDVIGDGNCGYYSIILGLENLGINIYSPNVRGTYPQTMQRSLPWQFSVMNFRRDMKTKSESLVKTLFTVSNAHFPWIMEICPLGEDDIAQLSEEFLSDDMTQSQYFDWSMIKMESRMKYMMSAYWGSIVAAYLLKVRILVYIRAANHDGSKLNYHWITVTIDPLGDPQHLFTGRDGLHKITDQQFRSMPTIELMLTTGSGPDGEALDKHYRYLRRVLCDDYSQKIKHASSSDPLRLFIRNEINQVSSDQPFNNARTKNKQKGSMAMKKQKGSATTKKQKGSATTKKQKDTATKTRQRSSASTTGDSNVEIETMDPEERTTNIDDSKTDQENERTTTTKQRSSASTTGDSNVEIETIVHEETTANNDDSKTDQENEQTTDHDETTANVDTAGRRKRKRNQPTTEKPPLGDSGFGDAPPYLCTNVITIHQQHSNPYCLSHSLASALFYCDNKRFRIASEGLVHLGLTIAGQPFDTQITKLRMYMEDHVPIIGRPTLYGRRPNSHKRKLRMLTWDEILFDCTPFPTVVIPRLPCGSATHAFCVVDDLIFDSTTPKALKLCRDSVKWLFREVLPEVYQVLRFNRKISPKGCSIRERYNRPVRYNWDHPANPGSTK